MTEEENLRIIEGIWDARKKTGTIRDATIAATSEDVEWWAAGPEGILPWAGTWLGTEGVSRWFDALNTVMEYDRAEPFERYAQGDTVIELFHGEGRAKPTGRPFKSDIARIYTMRNGKIVKVRNFYDTAAYVAALEGSPATRRRKKRV